MSPRSFFYRATLSGYALLLRLAFATCSRFYRLGHVPDLRLACADVSLLWFCVRIHECLALPGCYKNNRIAVSAPWRVCGASSPATRDAGLSFFPFVFIRVHSWLKK